MWLISGEEEKKDVVHDFLCFVQRKRLALIAFSDKIKIYVMEADYVQN